MDANVEPWQEEAVAVGADHAAGPDEAVASIQMETAPTESPGGGCDCFICEMRRAGVEFDVLVFKF